MRPTDALPAAIAGAGLTFAALDRGGLTQGPVLCAFRRVTGWSCPTCGMTRSVVATAHGDVAAAVRWHPFGPLVVAIGLIVIGYTVLCAARRTRPDWRPFGDLLVRGTIAVFVFGALRALWFAAGADA